MKVQMASLDSRIDANLEKFEFLRDTLVSRTEDGLSRKVGGHEFGEKP
jgi:hypothetical protein